MRILAAVLMTVMLTVAGCSGNTAGSGTPGATPTFNPLTDPTEVPLLLRQELGENVTVRRISLTNNGFSAEVRDPQKPENLDTYRYYGNTWDSDPVSMSMSDIENLDRTTFGLGAVDWTVIPDLQQQALAGLDLEDEEISVVSIDRIAGQQPRVYISVSGARGYGSLISDARGRNVEVRRN
ncbi:MAG: hypothetical protein V9E98_00655 [Candidatus Nanopelagicales bacterium]